MWIKIKKEKKKKDCVPIYPSYVAFGVSCSQFLVVNRTYVFRLVHLVLLCCLFLQVILKVQNCAYSKKFMQLLGEKLQWWNLCNYDLIVQDTHFSAFQYGFLHNVFPCLEQGVVILLSVQSGTDTMGERRLEMEVLLHFRFPFDFLKVCKSWQSYVKIRMLLYAEECVEQSNNSKTF